MKTKITFYRKDLEVSEFAVMDDGYLYKINGDTELQQKSPDNISNAYLNCEQIKVHEFENDCITFFKKDHIKYAYFNKTQMGFNLYPNNYDNQFSTEYINYKLKDV